MRVGTIVIFIFQLRNLPQIIEKVVDWDSNIDSLAPVRAHTLTPQC